MRAFGTVLLLGLLALPLRSASGEDAKAKAREAYASGEAAATAGKWDEAAQAFSLADALAPNDTALESALNAAERGSDPVLGMNLVERAKRSTTLQTMPVTAAVRKKFELRAGLLKMPCVTRVPACVASVDGMPIDRERFWVAPGSRKMVFDSGDQKAEVILEVAPGGEVEASPPAAAPKSRIEPSTPRRPIIPETSDETAFVSPLWLLIPGGVTLAAGATTIAFGVMTSQKETELAELQEAGRRADETEADYGNRQRTLVEDGEASQDATNGLIGVTAAAAAVTAAIGIFVIDWDGGESPAVAVVPTVGGLIVGGAFQ